MGLLLIEPYSALLRPPQALHYIASAVKANGHAVRIHDESLFGRPSSSLTTLLSSDSDIVGISVYTKGSSITRARQISAAIKAKRPFAMIVWGGWHPTIYGRECFEDGNVDVVVRGPGEQVMCELMTAKRQQSSLHDVPNILFRERGNIVETPTQSVDARYLFPPLDYELIDMGRYVRDHDQGSARLAYLTSRGCYGRCAFCSSRLVDRQKRIRKPAKQCLVELQCLVNKHKVHHLIFSDAVAFANREELEDLINIVRAVGQRERVTWRCDARADVLSRLPSEACKNAAENGCVGFAVGIESGVDRVLKLMRKDISVEQIEMAMNRLGEQHLDGNLFWFMTGYPGETALEASKTISLACRTRLRFPRSNIVLSHYDARLAGVADNGPVACAGAGSVRARVEKLSYYLGASVQAKPGAAGRIRRIRQNIALQRIKHECFGVPIEYYISKGRDLIRKRLR